MRLAIADPPYLGRAARWYGDGRGHAGGRGRPDSHPEASRWDTLDAHLALVADLAAYDGWALFTGLHGLRHILPACPDDVTVLAWCVTNAIPSGSRVGTSWEPIIVRVPTERRAHGTGPAMRSFHAAAAPCHLSFAGAKPTSVTRWVLDVLGHRAEDEVDDLFPGSGSVADVLAAPTLDLGGGAA